MTTTATCEHCSCLRVKGNRCCYCHEESSDQKRLEEYLKGKVLLKPKEEPKKN
jgi:hypothetical protein